MIYKYQKLTDDYTTYTLLIPDNIESTELVTLDGWTYVLVPDGTVLPTQPEQIADSVEEVDAELNKSIRQSSPVIQSKLNKINADVNTYICAHYDMGTQSSFNGIYTKRSTPDAVKDILDTVWDWIETVMGYYYTKKNEILTSDTPMSVTWDFSQFNESDPVVSLSDLLGG